MLRRPPPLNAARAFEAVARNGSVTRAASELSVTQGAVSRHVSALEHWLGTKLFVRTQRGVKLTRSTTRPGSCSKAPTRTCCG